MVLVIGMNGSGYTYLTLAQDFRCSLPIVGRLSNRSGKATKCLHLLRFSGCFAKGNQTICAGCILARLRTGGLVVRIAGDVNFAKLYVLPMHNMNDDVIVRLDYGDCSGTHRGLLVPNGLPLQWAIRRRIITSPAVARQP